MGYPAPPPKRRNTTLIVLLVVGGVAAFCCLAAAIGGFFLYRGFAEATGPAKKAVDEFVTDLEAGDYNAAYGRLCDRVRKQYLPDQFRQVAQARRITDHDITTVLLQNTNGSASATAITNLTYADGQVDTHNFQLVKESGQWRICGNPY